MRRVSPRNVAWLVLLWASALRAQPCEELGSPCVGGLYGDFDGDGDAGLDDWEVLLTCFTGPNGGSLPVECQCTNLDADLDSDLADFLLWQAVFTGEIKEPPRKAPANPCESGSGCRSDASPMRSVYLFSGEVFEEATDLVIRGRGLDFVWARKYRSRVGPNTAMGHGWDFSYNLYIERVGEHIRVHNGHARQDIFRLQPDGTWARDEFFQVLSKDPDCTYTLTFADTGEWNFNALDGSPEAGKIASIIDRNGNTLSFNYGASGRLTSIHDALDTPAHSRDITISYGADGFIDSVTDFVGRQVVYTHDASGDLVSVRGPVVNLPPPLDHNNFPAGKITSYTYSGGLADERLNHNLLTITDPKGQTFLVNTYAPTSNPADLDFDRVVTQQWGNPGETLSANYTPQTPPGESDSPAVIKAEVTERNGNVKHSYYDAMNRLVVARELTRGLRPGEPVYWETRWSYNADSLPTQIVHPNGNVTTNTYELALDPGAPRRSRGNLRQVERLPGPLGGDQASITESFTYETGFGGCGCGTNFVKTHSDARDNTTTHTYDAFGNRTHTLHRLGGGEEDWTYNLFGQVESHTLPANGSGHRRLDAYSYYAAGLQMGYLQSEVIDSGGFDLTTQYTYDAVGNMLTRIDPRDNTASYEYNPLDQVVRELSRPGGGNQPVARLNWYDANDNVIRADVENRDENGVLQPNAHYSMMYEYEILNHAFRTCHERGSAALSDSEIACGEMPLSERVVTEFAYDANRNRTLVLYGEAVIGNDIYNRLNPLYDERDLLYRSIRAAGSGITSSDQTDYDGNGNVTSFSQGLESAPRLTTYAYDGYDRRTSMTDPMGNVTTYQYDANGNLTSTRIDGELNDIADGAGNIRLYEVTYQYDAMDRRTRQDVAHFDTETGGAIGDGSATTQWTYADDSQVTSVSTDLPGHTTSYTHDTANRATVVTDAKGNTATYTFDANFNVTQTVEADKSDLGNPTEFFTTDYAYDPLDRLTQRVDNVGNTHRYGYDSRGNRVLYTDARGSSTRYEYDGLNRLTSTDRLVPEQPDGHIILRQTWDDSSRLTSQTDDNGNATTYQYDALDRRTGTDYADCTTNSTIYDVHDNRISTTDANETQVGYEYDELDRLTHKDVVVFGAGVAGPPLGTDVEIYQYDGLSRLIRAQDSDSLVARGSDSTSGHDSLSNILRETQQLLEPPSPPRTVVAAYDGESNLTQLVYPGPGGRTIAYAYDALDRPIVVNDDPPAGPPIATYSYIGPYRVERRDYPKLNPAQTTRLTYLYDGVRRIRGTIHDRDPMGASTPIDHRVYDWDANSNKMAMHRAMPPTPEDRFYTYDAANRLIRSEHIVPPAPPCITDYMLDGVGNRQSVVGCIEPGPYMMEPTLCEPGDFQMNQYTTTPPTVSLRGSGAPRSTFLAEPFAYSDGNLAGNGTWTAHNFPGVIPVQVIGVKVQLAQGPGSREDVNALLGTTMGPGQKFYAAFDLTHAGGNGSVYFAHFMSTSLDCPSVEVCSTSRVWITNNGLGDFTVGLSATGNTPVAWTQGLTFGTTYRIVASYEFDTGNVQLWVDPVDEGSASILDTGSSSLALSAYALRQATPSVGSSNQTIDNLCIGDSFAEALSCLAPPPDTQRLYDANGNLTDTFSVPRHYTYDYRNRLVQFFDAGTGQTTTYRYDCLGRRIEKNVAGASTRFYYDGGEEIEEQNAADATVATYVYSKDRHTRLQMVRGGQKYYYHEDDLGSVMKMTDSSGNSAESYSIGDFGHTSYFDQFNNPIGQSNIGNPYLFHSLRFEAETGLGREGACELDVHVGQYMQRAGAFSAVTGNARTFAGNNPASTASTQDSAGSQVSGGMSDEDYQHWQSAQPAYWGGEEWLRRHGGGDWEAGSGWTPTHPGALRGLINQLDSRLLLPGAITATGGPVFRGDAGEADEIAILQADIKDFRQTQPPGWIDSVNERVAWIHVLSTQGIAVYSRIRDKSDEAGRLMLFTAVIKGAPRGLQLPRLNVAIPPPILKSSSAGPTPGRTIQDAFINRQGIPPLRPPHGPRNPYWGSVRTATRHDIFMSNMALIRELEERAERVRREVGYGPEYSEIRDDIQKVIRSLR